MLQWSKGVFLVVDASLCWLNNVRGVQLVHFFGSAGFGTFLQVSALASHCANFTPKPEENDQYSANYSECKTSSKKFHYYQWTIICTPLVISRKDKKAANIIKPTQTRINCEIYFLRYKIIGAPKKFKNWPRPLFGSKTNHTCHQKPTPSRETVPLSMLNTYYFFKKK